MVDEKYPTPVQLFLDGNNNKYVGCTSRKCQIPRDSPRFPLASRSIFQKMLSCGTLLNISPLTKTSNERCFWKVWVGNGLATKKTTALCSIQQPYLENISFGPIFLNSQHLNPEVVIWALSFVSDDSSAKKLHFYLKTAIRRGSLEYSTAVF